MDNFYTPLPYEHISFLLSSYQYKPLGLVTILLSFGVSDPLDVVK
nr:MAG TPA: hypothetical protein [Bacteriophage sp.]